MRPRVTEWVYVAGDTLREQGGDYDVYIGPDSGVYEYGVGVLRSKGTPTLRDGRFFARHFMDRTMASIKLPEPEPFLLTQKKVSNAAE